MENMIMLLPGGVLLLSLLLGQRTRTSKSSLVVTGTGWRVLTALALISVISICTVASMTTSVTKASSASSATAGLSPNVDQSTGTFTSDVTIQVPAFHGLEPALKLHYSSTETNGWLGVGWQLIGPSSVERTSHNGGAPSFNQNDVYYLDGQELVSDTSLGGNYSTKFQTYQRIKWDGANNVWTVWQKGGMKATYSSAFNTSKGTESWFIASVSDTLGNTVHYTTACDGSNNCYVQKINYNGTEISLYNESRPDPIQRATGAGTATMAYRLKTVDVTTGGQAVRAYNLNYAVSNRTSRSILTSVQEYGRDRTLTSTGVISGGTALPAITFGTSSPTNTGASTSVQSATTSTQTPSSTQLSFSTTTKPIRKPTLATTRNLSATTKGSSLDTQDAKANTTLQQAANAVPWQWVQNPNDREWLTGDFNGDGLTDVAFLWRTQNGTVEIYIAQANGDGTYTAKGSIPTLGNGPWGWIENTTRSTWLVGDFNGDGRDDLAYAWDDNGSVTVYTALSNGDGNFTSVGQQPAFGSTRWHWFGPSDSVWLTGDFNGDGKSDISYVVNDAGKIMIAGLFSRGDGTFNTTSNEPAPDGIHWGWITTLSDRQWLVSDFNGDGKADIAYLWNGDGHVVVYQAFSNGDGSFNPLGYVPTPYWQWNSRSIWLAGDFNGDGETDLAYLWKNSNFVTIYSLFSNGNGTFVQHGIDMRSWLWEDTLANVNWKVQDHNGDGKSDILYLHNDSGKAWVGVALSQGDGTFNVVRQDDLIDSGGHNIGWPATLNDRLWLGGDVNGDQRSDLIFAWRNTDNTSVLYSELSNGNGTFRNVGVTPAFYTNAAHLSTGQPAANTASLVWKTAAVTGNAGNTPDLVTQVNNGLGGITAINYQPLSAWPNNTVPVGFNAATVASITTNDGRNNNSTTSYSYAGANWDYENERFLGFRQVKATINSQGDSLTTTYHRSGMTLQGKADTTVLANASGQIYEKDLYTYSENATAPYTSQLSKTQVQQYELGSAPRTIQTEYSYDPYGNTTTMIEAGDLSVSGDERTTATTYAYNTDTYLVASPSTVTVYAGVGTSGKQLSQVRNLYDGASSETTAPTQGLLTAKQEWNDQTNDYQTTSSVYDSYGNVIQTTDPLNHVSTTSYDTTYHLYAVSSTNALNQTTSQTWDAQLGEAITTTDINNNTMQSSYDALGRVTQTTRANGDWVSKNQYLNWGDPTQQHIRAIKNDGSNDGLWDDSYFDGLNRIWRTAKKGVDDTHTLYQDSLYIDATQNASKQSLPYVAGATPIWTSMSYDGEGRIESTTYADGAQQHVVYGVGMQKVYDPLNNEKDTYTDGLGHMNKVVEWNGANAATTTFSYNLRDQLTQRTDALGATTAYTLDSLGNKLQTVDADLGTLTYAYDANNQLTSRTRANGQTIAYRYDALGRPISTLYPDQSQVTHTYDSTSIPNGIGRLSTIIYPGGSSQINSYDYAGNITEQAWTVGGTSQTLRSTYDSALRPTSITFPDSEQVSYGYNAAGNLTSVSGYVQSMSYDAADHLIGQTNANGTTETFTYDPNRQWLTSATVSNGSTTLYQASYSSDKAGRINKVSSSTDPQLNLTYSYDPLSRLTQVSGAQNQTFSYDAVGNIITNSLVGSYSYGDTAHKHATTTAGANTYSYDENGNLTNGAGRTLTWNYENQLASLTEGDTSSTYTYNENGQRISKTVGDQTTSYFGSLMQLDGSGLTKYIYAGNRLVAQVAADGTRHWYHADHLGSTRLMTDSSGTMVQNYAYSAFGATVSKSGNVPNPFGFGGHHADSESGLLYMNARYYDPALGRFLSADTAGLDAQNPQKFNRYSYADNNPVNNVDPTGHDGEDYSGFSSSFGSTSGFDSFSSLGSSSSYSFSSSASFGTSSLGSLSQGNYLGSTTFGAALFPGLGSSSGSGSFGSGLGISSFSDSLLSSSISFSSSFSTSASLLGSTGSGYFGSNTFAHTPTIDFAFQAAGTSINGFSLSSATSSSLNLGSFAGLGYNSASLQDGLGIKVSAKAGSSAPALNSLQTSAAPDLNSSASFSSVLDAQQGTLVAGPAAGRAAEKRPDVYFSTIYHIATFGSAHIPVWQFTTDEIFSTDARLDRNMKAIAGIGGPAAFTAKLGGDAMKAPTFMQGLKNSGNLTSALFSVVVGITGGEAALLYTNNARIHTSVVLDEYDLLTGHPSHNIFDPKRDRVLNP